MPIYDYVCGSCGHRFEVLRGINEAGPHQCPECGGPVARAFVPPTIHFKGTGWAKADRRAAGVPAHRSGRRRRLVWGPDPESATMGWSNKESNRWWIHVAWARAVSR